MTNLKLLELFQNQLSQYYGIAKAEGLDSGLQGPPSAALAFAEKLMLCPTVNAAKAKMRQDQEAARAFLQVAMILDDVLPTLETQIAELKLTTSTPFFALASGVQEYLVKMEKEIGGDWK